MLTSPANGGYVELGTLDLTGGATTNLTELRSGIQPKVCRAGGDAALALVNGNGYYIKATVLKRVESAPPANANAANAANADATADGHRMPVRHAVQGRPRLRPWRVRRPSRQAVTA